MCKGRPPRVKLPPDFQGKPGDEEVNRSLAIYNRTGNFLALWDVLAKCLEYQRLLPEPVATIFQDMAHQLLDMNPKEFPKARSRIPDIVLGTTTSKGGPSVFRAYAQELRNRKYLAILDNLVSEHIVNKPLKPPAGRGTKKNKYVGPAAQRQEDLVHARSLDWIFATAAEQLAESGEFVEVGLLKRLYEQENKDAGTFRIRALVAAKRKPEIVELSASPSRRGRKRADSEE